MRLFLIFCLALLAACGARKPDTIRVVTLPPPPIEAELLTPCGGWAGPVPSTERQLIAAAAAERRGRERCNGKIGAIGQIVSIPFTSSP